MENSEKRELHFSPAKKKLAYEAIYENIKDQILAGSLVAGDKLLSEREMIQLYGYSHPTVREALSMLEKEGLIKIVPGKGAIVVEMTLDRFKHHFEVMLMMREVTPVELLNYRAAINVELAGYAAQRRQPEDISTLKNICSRMVSAKHDIDQIVGLDVEFHDALVHCARNDLAILFSETLGLIMKQHLNLLLQNLPGSSQQASVQEIIDSHNKILEAVSAQDQACAMALVKTHMDDYDKIVNKELPFIKKANEMDTFGAVKASQSIYDQIYAKILSGELKPGDRLPSERQLMDMFERSRPSVREALRMLESEGYITVFSGSKGAMINQISTEIIERPLGNIMLQGNFRDEDLLQFRTINDLACIAWATRQRSDMDIDVLRKIIGRMKDNLDNARAFFEYDVEFHKAIARSAHNSVAYIVSRVLINLVFERNLAAVENHKPQDMQENMKLIVSQHEAILAAIIAREEKKALSCVRSHIDGFKKMMG